MTIADRIRQSETIAVQGNFHVPDPKFRIDPLVHVKAAAARDPEIRPAAVAALTQFHRRAALISGLSSIVSARDARAQLAEAEFYITDAEFAGLFAIDGTAETSCLSLSDRLGRLNRERLEADLQPHVDRVTRAAIAAIRADVAQVDSMSSFLGKFGAAPDELRQALSAAADKLEQNAKNRFDLSWHYDPRIALCQCLFPDDQPLELPAPASSRPAATPAPAPASTLRTAAEVARAK